MNIENQGLFRFQNLEIWKRAAALSRYLFELADELENRRLFRFAEQLRAASLSITNNIAEGSGSTSRKDFANFSIFPDARSSRLQMSLCSCQPTAI